MIVGLVLAAGAGTRYGGPKGLARDPDGAPWVVRAIEMLRDAGCRRILVAVGARGVEVADLVTTAAGDGDVDVVRVEDWADGLSASLRAGLLAAGAVPDAEAVVVTPVDTPDAPAAAARRVIESLGADPSAGLAQAVYGSRPGHPVVIGAAHLRAVIASLSGDRGARSYLRAHGAAEVDCSDLWSGDDRDRP